MCRYGRACSASSLTIESIDRPFSNFGFIESRFPDVVPLKRIFSQVRTHGGKTLVVEDLNPAEAEDISEETEDISTPFATTIRSRVWRLSFFRKSFSTTRGLASAGDEDFIGYAVVKRDDVPNRPSKSRIYESVIRRSRREDNFIRGSPEWSCRVGQAIFRTSGYLYAQQNNMTNVCAHVACRTAAAKFHKDGDMTYREMNDLPGVNIDHVDRIADGLSSDQMVEILNAAGATCVVGDYTTPKPGIKPPPFQKLLYGSIESGYPAIICFATTGGAHHAVPVFGHTFNEDMWVPNAEWSYFRVGAGTAYMPSESWLSTYIAHDDNWGSNYCIPRHFLYTKRHCDNWPSGAQPCVMESECVAYIIATLPKVVKVNPIVAEVVGADYLFSMLPQLERLSESWGRRLELYARQHLLVLRPILIDSSDYVRHLESVDDWDRNHIRQELLDALRRLPESKVWMVELSVPELFSANRRKLGEVLIRAEIAPGQKRDFKNSVLARVPGYFALHKGGSAANPKYALIPSGAQGHVPLFGCENSCFS